jgi:hypothetical protein
MPPPQIVDFVFFAMNMGTVFFGDACCKLLRLW